MQGHSFTKRSVGKLFLSECRINCKQKQTFRVNSSRDLFLFSLNEQGKFYLKSVYSFKMYFINVNSKQILIIDITKCD